mgnify:FL=1
MLYNYNASGGSTKSNTEGVVTSDNTQFYLIPSANRDGISTITKKSTYSVGELYDQFYDSQLDDFVYSLKDASINDIVYVSDIINEIYYDAEHERTIFEFITQFGVAKWPFDGNLTLKYSKGDTIKFKFEVVNEYSTERIKFENIDYFKKAYAKLDDKAITLNINDYIAK